MSWILNSTPLCVTAFFGSGKRIAAGAHAWQMPHQVGMQRPLVWPSRIAHDSPIWLLHWLSVVHAVRSDWASMPWYCETPFSTPVTPNASAYFVDGALLLAPAHL